MDVRHYSTSMIVLNPQRLISDACSQLSQCRVWMVQIPRIVETQQKRRGHKVEKGAEERGGLISKTWEEAEC